MINIHVRRDERLPLWFAAATANLALDVHDKVHSPRKPFTRDIAVVLHLVKPKKRDVFRCCGRAQFQCYFKEDPEKKRMPIATVNFSNPILFGRHHNHAERIAAVRYAMATIISTLGHELQHISDRQRHRRFDSPAKVRYANQVQEHRAAHHEVAVLQHLMSHPKLRRRFDRLAARVARAGFSKK